MQMQLTVVESSSKILNKFLLVTRKHAVCINLVFVKSQNDREQIRLRSSIRNKC